MADYLGIELSDDHILHLDANSIVVDKEPGWPVHATRDPNRPHLVAAVRAWLRGRGESDPAPAVVHRLDVWTSGVVLLARTASARRELTRLFERREVDKVYEAICVGGPDGDGGVLHHYLTKQREQGRDVMRSVRSGGKVAITRYEVVTRSAGLSRVRLHPETGRTHQLRVQASVAGWPILGDPVYGDVEANSSHGAISQLLHAARLGYVDPFDGARREISSPLPARFTQPFSEL